MQISKQLTNAQQWHSQLTSCPYIKLSTAENLLSLILAQQQANTYGTLSESKCNRQMFAS